MKFSWALCLTLLFAISAVAAEQPRNIVLIMADDIGIEGFGCYGGVDYQTPRIDQLAVTGLRFTHAYAQPLCTPTRIELMTGRENHRNWLYFGIMPPLEKTIGHLMQSYGYKTCIAGKWQLQSYDPPDFPNAELRRGTGMHPRDAGFDAYSLFHSLHTEDKGSRYANPTYLRNDTLHEELKGEYGEDHNVQFLLDFMADHREEQIFLYYPMALPHWPMVPTPHSKVWQDSSRRLEESTDYFPDMVAYMDEIVGRLVDGIDDLGLREETLILFYSDNGTDARITSRFDGEDVQGGKASTKQTGIRVPLIANWPGHVKPGVNSDLVEASDFLPTLSALAGRELNSEWQTDGISFAPQLFGETGTPREWAFFWYDPRPGWDKMRFSRSIFALDKNYKLFDDGRLFEISGVTYREVPLNSRKLVPEHEAARKKLRAVIDNMMQQPISPAAQIEVDAYGVPVATSTK
ncbi:sulfatase-like hydrolase/transferase [Calycomorphotria hydatis]|uniref:Arylsulfatase n=1 Tax=Calycomorphotria hydatis TaxID=2528027 RepID=A0A517TF54_9PLAN|nr:sulfatase-like hydrolase/transferase [Calycomorphotria hydatis]QDT67006.1 Arylsulfatase [Calycomorphotria hydatis]